MTDRERVVGRRISRAEARSAESRLNNCSCLKQIRKYAVFHKFHVNRHGCRINIQGEPVVTDALIAQYVSCITNIFKSAARTSCDDTLVDHYFPVYELAHKIYMNLVAERHLRAFFCLMKDVCRVGKDFVDCVCAARMIRHSDHRLDLGKVYLHQRIIICHGSRCESLEILLSLMSRIILAGQVVCLPDRRKTCRLSGHDIHADSVIHGEICNAGSHKFHNLVLNKAILKYCADDCKRNILRSDTRTRLAGQINCNNLRHLDIIGA